MDFAIFQTGGKQYKAAVGDKIHIEQIPDTQQDQEIHIEDVLFVQKDQESCILNNDKKACVTIKILETAQEKKIIVFKKKQRKNYRRKYGHRQIMSHALVTNISIK